MHPRLKQAFERAAQLPEAEQEAVAAILDAELADEEWWTRQFAESQDQLAALADEALAEFERGETVPLADVLNEKPRRPPRRR